MRQPLSGGEGAQGEAAAALGPCRHSVATGSELPGVVSEAVVSSWGQRLRGGRRSCRPGLGLQVSYYDGTGHLTPGWKGDSRLFGWLGLRTRGGQARASASGAWPTGTSQSGRHVAWAQSRWRLVPHAVECVSRWRPSERLIVSRRGEPCSEIFSQEVIGYTPASPLKPLA